MQPNEAAIQLLLWGWSSIGTLDDDQWRCERPKDLLHPLGHRLYDGTIDDLGRFELWHGEELVTVPFWWVLYCAPDTNMTADPILARRN